MKLSTTILLYLLVIGVWGGVGKVMSTWQLTQGNKQDASESKPAR